MQLAFQIAHHRLTGRMAPVYESCSTAAFRHGRTETLRPLTPASAILVKAINEAHASNSVGRRRDALLPLLRAASERHNSLTKEAAQGLGWDRHLFALKHLALERGEDLPDLLADESYGTICRSVISTSTLGSTNIVRRKCSC